MKKIKKILILFFIIILYTCSVYGQNFEELTIYEQQDKIFEKANEYQSNSRTYLNTNQLIAKIYDEASDGTLKLDSSYGFNEYNEIGWLVKGILPETRIDVSHVYNECSTFGEQNDSDLLNINLIMANLKVGDIIFFKSKDSDQEESMLYIGYDNTGDTIYCKNGKIKKIKLRYYLGQELKNTNIQKRQDNEMPLVGVARPLTSGGFASYFEPEEKFYADFTLEKYELETQVSSSEFFTYDNAKVEYEDDKNAIGENNYKKIKDVLINSDSFVFQMIRLVENVGAMFLLSACIILGMKYMVSSNPEQKSKYKKTWILMFLATILIFFARRIAILIVDFLM